MKETSTEYTPTEALKSLDGISKTMFYNDMKNGNLSYREEKAGNKTRRYIEGSELARRYGNKLKIQNVQETSRKNITTHDETFEENVKTHSKNTDLMIEVEVLRQRMNDKNQTIDYLTKERNEWKETAQRKELLIEDMRIKTINLPVEEKNASLGSQGTEIKNNALLTSLLLFTILLLTTFLVYVTKSFWLPFLN